MGRSRTSKTNRSSSDVRTVWYNKIEFYNDARKGHSELNVAVLDKYLSVASLQGRDAEDELVKKSFKRTVSVDPKIVDLVWNVPLPECWEFAFAVPISAQRKE